MTNNTDTIVALATAAGKAGVGVIRVSGQGARDAIAAMTAIAVPVPRRAQYTTFKHPHTGEMIDKGLCLFFPAPHSFTGEDVAEFHIHSSRAVIATFLEALCLLPHTRLAFAGEFTKRAFQHEKLDLTQVEGLADLLDAETEKQRSQALRQLEGALFALYTLWQAQLLTPLAYLEAYLDFPEDDLPNTVLETVQQNIMAVQTALTEHLAEGARGERLRDGIRIALIGQPNAGKSSLLNALVAREAAIVSPLAGTTRDVIEVCLDIGGYAVILADTAGMRRSGDAIEQEGIKRAEAWRDSADIVLLVLDATAPLAPQQLLCRSQEGQELLVVCNKMDIVADKMLDSHFLHLSLKTGEGLDALKNALLMCLEKRYSNTISSPLLTRVRHRAAATAALESLNRALVAPLPELMAEDVRHALHKLGELVGKYDVEALLDIVFRDFCIGK